ncbi:MAG TPA: general stress protein [Aliidongia sp.]|nr:general stress protein [Aliidongia sp.]
MTRTLTALYDSYEDAEATVRDLEAAGIPDDDISLVANTAVTRRESVKEGNEAGPGAGAGAGLGAVVGGGAGLLAGLGMMAIPGVGPVVAAGWLVATLVGAAGGAVVGGAAGGLIGAMIGNGVPEEDANVYAEGVRRGGTLITVRVGEDLVTTARRILDEYRPVDARARGEAYRKDGWSRFDENAPVYTEEELERERQLRTSTTV